MQANDFIASGSIFQHIFRHCRRRICIARSVFVLSSIDWIGLTSWTHGIDVNTVRSAVQSNSSRQVDNGPLRGAITSSMLPSDKTKRARDVDDPPSITVEVRFLSQHLCDGVLATEKGAFGVDSLRRVPGLLRQSPNRFVVCSFEIDASIVDEAISRISFIIAKSRLQ